MFLLRSTQAAAANQQPQVPSPTVLVSAAAATATTTTSSPQALKYLSNQPKPVATSEGLIVDDRFAFVNDDRYNESPGGGSENGIMGTATYVKDQTPISHKHVDVTEDEGWIIIPQGELPSSWMEATDMRTFRSLDRSFVFPGEQVHIMACLSASKQDAEIVTPFKVAAALSKNGVGKSEKKQNGHIDYGKALSESGQVDGNGDVDTKDGGLSVEKCDPQLDVSSGESLVRMEDCRKQIQNMLQTFEESHFFVRIADSDELLWSPRSSSDTSEAAGTTSDADDGGDSKKNTSSVSAMIDKGGFNPRVSGGVGRNSVKCCSLPNGDVVVLLQVNVGVDFLKEPTLEILQFEKYKDGNLTPENSARATFSDLDGADHSKEGHRCEELLKWLLPLDNSHCSFSRPLAPPLVNTSHKSSFSASSSSQSFSFGNFRSYSMSSLSAPQNLTSSSPYSSSASSNSSLEFEDWDNLVSQDYVKSKRTGSEELLSFRGVPLKSERFSVRCALEGIYVPGRRWRKHLEIVHPIDIQTFAANCNTDDLLCVQIKNVSPDHIPDVIIHIDAITIILEEVSGGGPPLSIPVTCIEAGTDYSLPNIALRRGEEHSFLLKPATSVLKTSTVHKNLGAQLSRAKAGKPSMTVQHPIKSADGEKRLSNNDQYSVLVSCRCNYTESRLFFKKRTDWRPRISRDLMISVVSEMSTQDPEHDSRGSQLPVQVLTLQASNLTTQDLSLTILAPASVCSSHTSIVSLNTGTSTPIPRPGSTSLLAESQKHDDSKKGARSLSFDEQAVPMSDSVPTSGTACNHLWLQSRVPLGCVPSQSTTKVKLELLPLTDGIISLDTLQISVKEKGKVYIPEQPLKIHATSSIASKII